jgi:hypothetical protein
MSIVTLEFDNLLEKSEIVMPLLSSSKNESGDNYNDTTGLTDKVQTAVFGIQAPLIMINSTIIDFDAVKYFSLKSKGSLPELVMTVEDRFELVTNIDKPSNDNEVRVQIIPRFDNAYKKIDLTFFITNIQVTGKLLRLTCSYKLSSLLSSQYKSFGEIDTYTLFKQIATETQLGFATNVAEAGDNRYVYCDNRSLYELMTDEIQFANAKDHILDWWVDLWDNINLVDIKERYNTVDPKEELQVWTTGQTKEVGQDIEVKPIKVPAVINNYPGFSNSELFVKAYNISNHPGMQMSKGTDKVFGIYSIDNKDYDDILIQDGDIKKDIFSKYNYIGENYGEYEYLMAKYIREGYIQKISSDTINVTLASPLLGLMRGHKVNFIRYTNNDMLENKMSGLEQAGLIDRNVESNISLHEYEMDDSGNGKFRVDKTVSGQYLIYGVDIVYNNNAWEYILTLVKPAATAVSIIQQK